MKLKIEKEPEVFIGEKFKYKSFKQRDFSLTDMYGNNIYFEDVSKIILEVVDFFPGKANEYKVRFIYNNKTKLHKWYFEDEILHALENGLIFGEK